MDEQTDTDEQTPEPIAAPVGIVPPSNGESGNGESGNGEAALAVPAVPPSVEMADGRRRRRVALAVLLAAILAGAAGIVIGRQIESPADRAAARGAPTPSLVTVPVERRQLTSEIVLSGEVAYNEPLTVALAGAVGLEPGETGVVTELRETGSDVPEGTVLLEVTTRPVFVLQGELPMYRRLAVGTQGPDVAQLEQALVRLGYDTGTVDTVFDAATAAAVDQMYTDAGYAAEGASAEQRTELVAARDAVTSAERALADARKSLADAAQPLPESQRLQLVRAVEEARQAVPAAQAQAQATRVEQDQMVATARAARDTAQTIRDAAVTLRDVARSPGAIDPDTGAPYTPERVAALDVAAAEAQQAYTEAEAQLVIAEQTRASSVANADAAVDAAVAQREIAEAQFAEGTAGPDTTALEQAVSAAETALANAHANLATLEAAAGTRVAPGEIVFAPVLPATLTETYVALGSAVTGPIGMLTTSETLVRARIARADSTLVAVGAEVEIEIRDAGISGPGTVLSIGQAQQQTGPGGDPGFGVPGGGETGRMEVVVAPGPGLDIGSYIFFGARVRVPIDATDGEVLVVPVAALTVGPDETSQVEVERVSATDDTPAETDIVAVTVGLTAGGLAEVEPVEPGALKEGDRVVIGVDTHLLPGNAGNGGDGGDGDRDVSPGGEGSTPADGDDDDDDDDDDESASPLAELMGWVSDPVEQRRQELAIEEKVAECMQDEGWEYTPVDWSAQMPETDVDMSDPGAFGEKYGYGVMYNYETYEQGSGEGPIGPGFEDPNLEYVNSLSAAEQQQYYADLYGEPVMESGVDEVASDVTTAIAPGLDQQGCQGQARLEVVGEDPGSDPDVQRVLDDYYQSQQNDPGLDGLVADWIDCLQPKLDEYGIDAELRNIYDGYQVMEMEKYRAQGAELVAVANQAEMDEYFNRGENVLSAWTDESGAGFVVLAPDGGVTELTGDQIDELTEIELDLWRTDRACQDEVGYAEYVQQQEQQLVDRLLSEFPELGG